MKLTEYVQLIWYTGVNHLLTVLIGGQYINVRCTVWIDYNINFCTDKNVWDVLHAVEFFVITFHCMLYS